MKNKLFTAVLALSLLYPISNSNAVQDSPVLAILDTGIDTSLPKFAGKIAGEVCILEWALCPNGTKFEEGPGSASMPAGLISKNGFDHGTHMADVAISTNPNIKILFIKIVGNTSTGLRKPTSEATVSAALNWVFENKDKYNIKAVSMSQGTSTLNSSNAQYCPSFPRTVFAVDRLLSAGIPLFAAVGNGRNYSRVDWPSCIPQVIAVGATDQINEIASYSNNDSLLLDFFALGNMQSSGPGNIVKNIAGTSASTQVVASTYLSLSQNTGKSGSDLISIMSANALQTKGRQGVFTKMLSRSINPSSVAVKVDTAAADKAAAEAAADKAAAEKLAADRLTAIRLEAVSAIAAAEAQYAIELKAAQDKLASAKALWMAKLNG